MTFTYNAYLELITSLRSAGYEIADYHNWEGKEKCVILRHDVDTDIAKATDMARLEAGAGIKSTYFVLLTSDFYNVFSKASSAALHEIMGYGHEIGLHFDEVCYPELEGNLDGVRERILEESRILEKALGAPVTTVSMHRPSKMILDADLQIPGMVNSYGDDYFKGFKYLSDSRRRWREPAEEIIASGEYPRLHILTHAFWYNESEKSLSDSLLEFINSANRMRYSLMNENFTRLEDEIRPNQVLG